MKSIRVKVNPVTSKFLQELAFEHGYMWNSGSTEVKRLDSLYLYFSEDKWIAYGLSEDNRLLYHETVDINEAVEVITTSSKTLEANVPFIPYEEGK